MHTMFFFGFHTMFQLHTLHWSINFSLSLCQSFFSIYALLLSPHQSKLSSVDHFSIVFLKKSTYLKDFFFMQKLSINKLSEEMAQVCSNWQVKGSELNPQHYIMHPTQYYHGYLWWHPSTIETSTAEFITYPPYVQNHSHQLGNGSTTFHLHGTTEYCPYALKNRYR